MDTSRFMSRDAAQALQVGAKVRCLVGGWGDVDNTEDGGDVEELTYVPGTIVEIASVEVFGNDQGLAVTIVAPNGVVSVFDELDFDKRYPFEAIGEADADEDPLDDFNFVGSRHHY